MLIRVADLEAIRDARIDTQFRRWKRPTVKAGGTLLTAVGLVAIDEVDPVSLDAISAEDISRAGFQDLAALAAALRGEGQLYRIRLHLAGDDPRIALREAVDKLDGIAPKLARMDAAQPWTRAILTIIRENPGVSAQILADRLGMEKQLFKTRVRRLKALGLTESLEVGYRIAPRGAAVLDAT
ncbi:winged helix-turn-helix domain-containing protein [Devosia sp. LjRoot3]|uniref:winged helix-turn-helix domain-containing protein n=1 Tax=Devosia sp. LjRoot3 TaxID=3342319 RepID=UPI003ECD7AEC